MIVQFGPYGVSFFHLAQDLYLYIWNRREKEAPVFPQQQNYPLAKARYREALVLYRAFGSPTYIAACLDGYAATACAERHYAQATRLCAAAATLREQTQTELLPAERKAFEQVVATARASLDEPAFGKEWNTGTTLTQDEAIDDALSDLSGYH
jgi:hypothetical protein